MVKIELPDELLEAANLLRTWAEARPFVRRLYIYGSRLKGSNREDSDIDVAIEFIPVGDHQDCLTIWIGEARNWRTELAPLLPWPLHLEWYDPNGGTPRIAKGLKDASVVVFSRES